MVLVDTSVVIDLLRSRNAELRERMGAVTLGICGITRAEVLHGVRTPDEVDTLKEALASFVAVEFPEALWDQVGLNLAALRRAGVRYPLPDVAIATLALHLDAELWSRDAHFTAMQTVLTDLQLFDESTPAV